MGGQEKVTLSTQEIPSHVHNFADAYFIEAHSDLVGANGTQWIGNNLSGSNKTDRDNSYVCLWDHDTRAAGGGQPHENRPPYYVLAYIIKL